MTKSNFLSGLLKFFAALIFNSIVGATISVYFFDGDPVKGAVIANVVAAVAGVCFPRGNAARAGVLTELWTGEMIKAFRTPAEAVGWYDRVRSYDQYVNNDVIHFTEIGGDPNVLVNNKTYPLKITALEDADKPISLDKFDTEATPVTDDELHALSYDKMASVQERHKEALKEYTRKKALHAYAPDKNVAEKTPVIKTTGAVIDGRKTLTTEDLVTLKRECDAMGMPKEGRVLILNSEHSNDLLLSSKNYADHYNINETDGKITRLYGFDIYEYDGCPFYTVSNLTEVAWGKAPSKSTDRQASIALHLPSMMKANGSVQFYHSEAKNDPLYHRNLVNFRKWGIGLPLKANCTRAAIVSDNAA